MKKQIVVLAVFGVVASFVFGACANPKKDREEEPPRTEKKKGCGCQSSENILDLSTATENAGDGLTNPKAKL